MRMVDLCLGLRQASLVNMGSTYLCFFIYWRDSISLTYSNYLSATYPSYDAS